MKHLTDIYKNIFMLTQLGLSFITPLLLCVAVCWWMHTKMGVGGWVFVLGFFFGMGGSVMVAYKLYLSTVNQQKKEKEQSKREKISFNRHL